MALAIAHRRQAIGGSGATAHREAVLKKEKLSAGAGVWGQSPQRGEFCEAERGAEPLPAFGRLRRRRSWR